MNHRQAVIQGADTNKNHDTTRNVIFYTQYYTPKTAERRQEIEACITHNASLEWVDTVVLFCENGNQPCLNLPPSTQYVATEGRLAFGAILKHVAEQDTGNNTIVIVANSDIFLDPNLPQIFAGIRNKDCLCLTRYESESCTNPFMIHTPKSGEISLSQDAWVFKAKAFHRLRLSKIPAIPLGKPGCENVFAHFLYRNRIKLSNPCLGIRVTHNHNCQHRTYQEDDRIIGMYAYPRIQTVEDFMAGQRLSPIIKFYDGHNYIRNFSLKRWIRRRPNQHP